MKSVSTLRGAVVVTVLCATAGLLEGCANGAATALAPPGAAPDAAWARSIRAAGPAKSKDTLYVSAITGPLFDGYSLPSKKPSCAQPPQKSGVVNSIAVDAQGNVWLPTQQFDGPPQIVEYAPNCGAAGTALNVPTGDQPIGLAIGNDGTKYALMETSPVNGKNGPVYVSVYAPGALNPTAELTDARLNALSNGIGIDAAGNVYVSCCGAENRVRHKTRNYLVEFKPGGNPSRGKLIVLAQIHDPWSVSFDGSGNLVVPDHLDSALYVYQPPYTGTPAIYPLQGPPLQCALDSAYAQLACVDLNQDTYESGVDVYSYPAVDYEYSLPNEWARSGNSPAGVAFAPN